MQQEKVLLFKPLLVLKSSRFPKGVYELEHLPKNNIFYVIPIFLWIIFNTLHIAMLIYYLFSYLVENIMISNNYHNT